MAAPPPPIAVLRGHDLSITSLCFQGNRLFSASRSGEIYCWDLKTRRISLTLAKSQGETDDGILRVCADDSRIVANSRLGRILIFNLDGQLQHEEMTRISNGFAGCRISGTDIVFADAFDGRIMIYDLNSNTYFPIATFNGHGMIMDISSIDTFIGVVHEDSTISVWDTRNSSEPLWKNNLKLQDPLISLSLIKERSGTIGERCVVGGSKEPIYEVTKDTSSIFYNMPHPGIDDIVIRSDGKIWATAGWDGRVRLFDAKKKKPLAVLKHHQGGIHTVAFADDGLLASGGDDRGIALWSLYRQQP